MPAGRGPCKLLSSSIWSLMEAALPERLAMLFATSNPLNNVHQGMRSAMRDCTHTVVMGHITVHRTGLSLGYSTRQQKIIVLFPRR